MAASHSIGHAVGHFVSSHLHFDSEKAPVVLAETASFLAFFGSCCALPLFLLLTGVGSMAFAITLVPYRPYFVAATLALLGISFYLVYGRKNLCHGATCSLKKIRRTRFLLWLSTSFVILFLVGPYIYEFFR